MSEKKFELNSHAFDGIRILYKHLDEGLKYAKEYKIYDVCIWEGMEKTIETVDLSFLKDYTFIEKLHVVQTLSKKSNIDGLYNLFKLKDLRWAVGNNFKLDFSQLPNIEILSIGAFHSLAENWNSLINLRELYIQSINNHEDLEFLNGLKNLKKLRIINGKILSLKGLEKCQKLESITIARCSKLKEVMPILEKLPNLKSADFEKCKNINISESFLKKMDDKIWIG